MTTTGKGISRREFLKYAGGGLAIVLVGSKLAWLSGQKGAFAATQALTMSMTDAVKEMVTHNSVNTAECYFWCYKCDAPNLPFEVPGPVIMVGRGDTINISLTNNLDEPHTLSVPGLGFSGPSIAPGATVQLSIPANVCGSHLYFDHLNAPVNRMMGLHGAIIVLPTEADRTPGGHNLTPYGVLPATHAVQRLYDDFGNFAPGTALTTKQARVAPTHFPGLAWEEGDSSPWALYNPAIDGPIPVINCPPMRSYLWLTHQASPKLFAEVGNAAPNTGSRIPANFMQAFLHDPFQKHAFHTDNPAGNRIPQYFTINGQSGFFSHFSPQITMMGRVGEPCVVHILNAGLMTHSMHLHANHMWITSRNGQPNPNPVWVDVFRVDPMDSVDYTVPYMRPPDVGNVKGIGPFDLSETRLNSDNGHPTWPPIEEFNVYMPPQGTLGLNAAGAPVELGQRSSPLCYPMHDHSEPTQTAQGGNYNMGLISGIYFTGDRNLPGFMDFPMDDDFHMGCQNVRGCSVTQPVIGAAPPVGENPVR